MHYTALITRMFSMSDESLQVTIKDTDSFDTFKTRVYDILKITDHRAHTQMQRLFEDTNLTDSLGYEDLQHARHAAKLMYPLETVPPLSLGSAVAFEFAKNLASGEVVKIFLHNVETYEDLNIAIKNVWELIDSRLQKTNRRELKFMEYCQKVPYETRLKIAMLMDILYGRNTVENVTSRLRQDNLETYVEEMRKNVQS